MLRLFRKVRFVFFYLIHLLSEGMNIRKTIIINFRFLPFKQAWKFPILIFGKMKIMGNGKIIINGKIHCGIIKIGVFDYIGISNDPSLFYNWGTVVFNGMFVSSNSTTIATHNKINPATIIFGKDIKMGYKNNFQSFNRIEIGNHTRIAHQIQVFDTNFHYLKDVDEGTVLSLCAPVSIGEHCWIGNRSDIMKGCCLPNGTVVGAGSLANKDYRNILEENCVVAGRPIIKKASSKRRIIELEDEAILHEFYRKNPTGIFIIQCCNDES